MKKAAVLMIPIALIIAAAVVYLVSSSGTRLDMDGNNIRGIRIEQQPEFYNTGPISVTNEAEIKLITDYLNGLELKSPNHNPDEYDGSAFVFTIENKDGTERTIVHFGNKFLRANDEWYEISYEQASRFDEEIYPNLEAAYEHFHHVE
ncbi:hypothetical protein [Paenibacillus antibioticophila]|uniref:hypothetical protein n=1 Tax=Paenibacillus antibioticophila TaxID=1274374 RepID=UPI0005C927A7|nr:hypothetical protein [Paenibacillus antibioticophila]